MRMKPSKKNNPKVIDVLVNDSDSIDSVDELDSRADEILSANISHDEEQPEPEESQTKDAATWEAMSTALSPTTTLSRYLAEVRRYPFLTKEEELQLFK